MKEDKLSTQSMDFAVSIIELVKFLKEKRESIISNQIGRSGTSIGANIREAHYAHGNFFYKYIKAGQIMFCFFFFYRKTKLFRDKWNYL